MAAARGEKHARMHTHRLNATRAAAAAAVTVAYFPSSSYSWYSSVNRVEVTTVAMLTEVTGERGGESPRALQWPPRAGFGRRSREGREVEEERGSSSETGAVRGDGEERRGESRL